MTKKQTAIEWFASELSGHLGPSHGPELLGILTQALAMEKEQIIEAHWNGCSSWNRETTGEQYYAETFNTSKG